MSLQRSKSGTRAEAGSDAEVWLTHPDRVVYPDRKITKQEVAEYYRAVMPFLLPEIANRPLSVVRCPSGIRSCFFQKHGNEQLGEHVLAVKLREQSGKATDYLYVNDARGVLDLVQMNTLEFHPWGATVDNPDRADRLVFDLDPSPQVDWRDVIAAGRLVRDLLGRLSLRSFVRVSGGKGLHVVVPLKPACPWRIARSFARSFAHTLAEAKPGRFVDVAAKSSRTGKIFIDYLRNGRGATSVASYSLRARPAATVALPVSWDELGKLKSADVFDIRNVPARLGRLRRNPWAEVTQISQDLATVMPAMQSLIDG